VALVLTRSSTSTAKIIIALVVICDQVTKHWALNSLNNGRTIDIFWTLRFNLVFNSGMAFSKGQGLGRLIGLLAIGVAVWLWLSLRKASTTIGLVGTAMLIGGAIGNVVDRLFAATPGSRDQSSTSLTCSGFQFLMLLILRSLLVRCC